MKSAYDGIKVTPAMLDAVLVQGPDMKWFRFQLWADRIFIMNRRLEWRNWKDFNDAYIDDDLEELRAEYTKWYHEDPPRNAKKVTLTKCIWAKMYLIANDRTDVYGCAKPKDPVTGKRERKRNLDRRMYRALGNGATVVHLQAQAMITYRALLEYQRQTQRDTISEAGVRDVMTRMRDDGTLRTKQDPFRIFQYYRPALIKAGLLEESS